MEEIKLLKLKAKFILMVFLVVRSEIAGVGNTANEQSLGIRAVVLKRFVGRFGEVVRDWLEGALLFKGPDLNLTHIRLVLFEGLITYGPLNIALHVNVLSVFLLFRPKYFRWINLFIFLLFCPSLLPSLKLLPH